MPENNPVTPRPNKKRRFWKAHIERWRTSGLSQVAYCRDNGLAPHQLTYWKKRLVPADTGVSFVPLKLTGNLPVPAARCPINLFTPNGYRIEVGTGFDPMVLKQLISVVSAV